MYQMLNAGSQAQTTGVEELDDEPGESFLGRAERWDSAETMNARHLKQSTSLTLVRVAYTSSSVPRQCARVD